MLIAVFISHRQNDYWYILMLQHVLLIIYLSLKGMYLRGNISWQCIVLHRFSCISAPLRSVSWMGKGSCLYTEFIISGIALKCQCTPWSGGDSQSSSSWMGALFLAMHCDFLTELCKTICFVVSKDCQLPKEESIEYCMVARKKPHIDTPKWVPWVEFLRATCIVLCWMNHVFSGVNT